MKNILDQSILQARLCENPVLVSVDELQKAVVDITRDKVNPQEPPSVISSITQVQPLIQTTVDKSTNVDTNIKVNTSDKVDTIEKK